MTRPVLVTIGASAAVLVALGVAKHFRASTSADTIAAPAQVSAARQVPGTAARESSSPVGWIAKPGLSTGGQKAGDRAAAWSDSPNEAPDTASSRTEGSATVLSSGSRPGSFIGTGRGVGSDGTGAVNIQTSVPAAALPSDLSNPAAGGSHPAGGQQGAQTGAAQSQAAVSGSDAAQSTNPDDQGPVLSISFDNLRCRRRATPLRSPSKASPSTARGRPSPPTRSTRFRTPGTSARQRRGAFPSACNHNGAETTQGRMPPW